MIGEAGGAALSQTKSGMTTSTMSIPCPSILISNQVTVTYQTASAQLSPKNHFAPSSGCSCKPCLQINIVERLVEEVY